MITLYIDPGYTNIGWALSTGPSGGFQLTGALRDRVEQLRKGLPTADKIVLEDYTARGATLSGTTTMLVIGALHGMHLNVDLVGANTWPAEFNRRVELIFHDISERIQFVERFGNISNEHERDACKIRFSQMGHVPSVND